MSVLAAFYLWIKALHVISMVAWMAGLLYLPRLFVYHADAAAGSPTAETFKVMERRLLRGIMNPAMIVTLLFGILLALVPGVVDWGQGWIYAKLALVAALVYYHHRLARWRRDFERGENRRQPRFFRFMNEIPTLILIAIVVLVVVKPF